MSVYVYAIVGSPRNAGRVSSAAGSRLRAVRSASTAAIVEDRETPAPTRRMLQAHDRVVRRIAAVAPAVLPVRFGTTIPTDRALVSMLMSWSSDLRTALRLVDGCEQMTLRLFVAPAAAGEPTANRPGDSDPGTTYLTQRADAQSRARSAPEIDPLREALGPLLHAERVAPRRGSSSSLVTAYHLIPRGSSSQYRRRLQRRAAALGLRAVISGPWPPYAFVPELRP